jgi:serine protease
MKKIVLGVLLTIAWIVGTAQSKTQRFKMPANVGYSKGRVLVKLKQEYKANFSSNLLSSSKNLNVHAAAPLVKPETEKYGAAQRAARGQKQVIDISRYFAITFDPSTNVESYINKLYATGYFEIVEPEYTYTTDFTPSDPSISQQYYLNLIKAIDAWDISKSDTTMVIAIVDTGGNLTHEDLKPNLYRNWKEYPKNGIDDDGNGFIDDYQGWDFIGADTLSINDPNFLGDNDPTIHAGGDIGHGTWVAGCASASTDNGKGIAGVGFKSRIMFTKQSGDNQRPTDPNEHLAYSGLLYAGYQKDVKIINCSFGGPGQSQIIQDIINHIVLDQNKVIIASAGNDGTSTPNYPAAYDNVLSVAATDRNDKKASFSTYGSTVDISAPGVGIYTTSYDNTYSSVNGTSFSSPITAGAAALVWSKNPTMTAVQVMEQLRISADATALYTANATFKNQLGKGRLDIKNALTAVLPSVRASNPKLINLAGLTPVPGDKAFLSFDFTNYLSSTSGGLQISLSTTSSAVTITKSSITPGIIPGGSTISNKLSPFELTIKTSAAQNTVVSLLISYSDGNYSDYQVVTFYVNPSFVDVNSNQISTTVTSIGRIGFQDSESASRVQGQGFIFNQNPLLYEMGLIMGTSSTNLFNNVRGIDQGYDQDFSSTIPIKQILPGTRSYSEVYGEFANSTAQKAVVVDYRSLVWKDAPYDKFIILEYQVKNPTANPLNNFYFGIFSDWDITTDGQSDAAGWDNNNKLGYVYPAQTAAKPYAGIQLLTGSPGYYAIDNDNKIAGNPLGLYDDFTDNEKFTTISASIGSGHERLQAGIINTKGNDVSHVVSSGPFNIAAGQTVKIAFALHAAANLSDLQTSARYADSVYNYTLKAIKPVGDSVGTCYKSSATLHASGASKIKWYKSFTGGESFLTGTQFTTGNLLNDTAFYVANADHSYESVRSRVKATVVANPKISTSGSTTICQGDTIKLSVANADDILWSTGAKTPIIQVTKAGTYTVQVKNNAPSCLSNSDPVSISVNPKPQANFSISSGDLKIQTPITFTDQSVNAVTWFWDFGDGQNSSSKTSSHTYTTINNYTVKLSITASNGCADTKSSSISVITGIEKLGTEPFVIYPNPVISDYLNVVVPSGLSFSHLMVTDILGRQVSEAALSTQETEQKVYVGNLNDGIYIVRISSDQGQSTKKIVIKR